MMATSFAVEPPADLSTLPEPPVPADLDLRHFDWMHLNTVDLLDSPIWEECSDAGIASALRLWARAWQQVPCSSLPNDARKVRSWAGCEGRLKRWKSVQKDALRGFVLCNDGRLYHHKVAEAASNAASKSRAGKRGAKAKWDKVNALKNNKTHDATASSTTDGKQDGRSDDIIYGSGDGKTMRPHMQRREEKTLTPLPPSSAPAGSGLDGPATRPPLTREQRAERETADERKRLEAEGSRYRVDPSGYVVLVEPSGQVNAIHDAEDGFEPIYEHGAPLTFPEAPAGATLGQRIVAAPSDFNPQHPN